MTTWRRMRLMALLAVASGTGAPGTVQSQRPRAGHYELMQVNGRPLNEVTWIDRTWTSNFQRGEIDITKGGKFSDFSQIDAIKDSVSRASGSTATGRVALSGDSLRFYAQGAKSYYAMNYERTPLGGVILHQRFGPLLLQYEWVDFAARAARALRDSARARREATAMLTPQGFRRDAKPAASGGADCLRLWATGRTGVNTSAATRLNTLPPALDALIRRAIPAFRLRVNPGAVLILDLDGDGRSEALVVSAPIAVFGRDSISLLLGIRQTAAGYEIRELSRSPSIAYAMLTAERRSAAGRSVGTRRSTTWWIRVQDGYCKDTGWVWRVVRGKWVRVRSDCSYGE